MHAVIEGLVERFERGEISRRHFVLALATLAFRRPAAATPVRPAVSIAGLNHVSLFVSDLDRSVGFYRELFGLEIQSTQVGGVNLALGDSGQFLGVYQVPGAEPRIDHLCLSVEGFDAERVLGELEERGIEARIRRRDEVPELYFTDPDGLSIQLQDTRYCGGSGPLGEEC